MRNGRSRLSSDEPLPTTLLFRLMSLTGCRCWQASHLPVGLTCSFPEKNYVKGLGLPNLHIAASGDHASLNSLRSNLQALPPSEIISIFLPQLGWWPVCTIETPPPPNAPPALIPSSHICKASADLVCPATLSASGFAIRGLRVRIHMHAPVHTYRHNVAITRHWLKNTRSPMHPAVNTLCSFASPWPTLLSLQGSDPVDLVKSFSAN